MPLIPLCMMMSLTRRHVHVHKQSFKHTYDCTQTCWLVSSLTCLHDIHSIAENSETCCTASDTIRAARAKKGGGYYRMHSSPEINTFVLYLVSDQYCMYHMRQYSDIHA